MSEKQQDLFGPKPYEPHYSGETYVPERDFYRLNAQTARVYKVMKDGRWHTLHDIAVRTGDPSPSISARLRDLRKERFGGHLVARRYVARGLFEYRLELSATGVE